MSRLVARWLALPPNFRGILWVGLSGVVFALLNVFTLIPSQHLNPYVMAFLRYLFGALFLVPLVIRLEASEGTLAVASCSGDASPACSTRFPTAFGRPRRS